MKAWRILRIMPRARTLGFALALNAFAFVRPLTAQIRDLGAVESVSARFRLEVLAESLAVPAGFAILPDGRLLVAERRAGRFTLVDPRTGARTPLRGQPPVNAAGDGGAHEVVLHPDFARNGWIYVTYSMRAPGSANDSDNVLALDRFRLAGTQVRDREQLFLSRPAVPTTDHFGGRIVFAGGYLFLTSGDRSPDARWRGRAQDLSSHQGKVLRLFDDGRVPPDNPFVGQAGALPEIWTLGHRNPQGLAVEPRSGALWAHEHGPMGGDEINALARGRNYGWPIITFGREYSGRLVGEGLLVREGLEQPLHYWVPSIAPSGMAFYDAAAIPGWRGSLFVGAMARRHLARLVFDGEGRLVLEERLLLDRGWRVRDVRVGPEGAVYIAVDDGMIVRLR